jgi:hypothetical protein
MKYLNKYCGPVIIMFFLILLSGCKYKKGDMYLSIDPKDSLRYIVLDKGEGNKLIKKSENLKIRHENRGNVCEIRYVTDSSRLHGQKSVLLFNSAMPDAEEDFLSKGYFGAFSSKQYVIYVLVSYDDMKKYFKEIKGDIKAGDQ